MTADTSRSLHSLRNLHEKFFTSCFILKVFFTMCVSGVFASSVWCAVFVLTVVPDCSCSVLCYCWDHLASPRHWSLRFHAFTFMLCYLPARRPLCDRYHRVIPVIPVKHGEGKIWVYRLIYHPRLSNTRPLDPAVFGELCTLTKQLKE